MPVVRARRAIRRGKRGRLRFRVVGRGDIFWGRVFGTVYLVRWMMEGGGWMRCVMRSTLSLDL